MRLQKAPAGPSPPCPTFSLIAKLAGCKKRPVFAFRGKVVTSSAGLKYLRFVLFAGVRERTGDSSRRGVSVKRGRMRGIVSRGCWLRAHGGLSM